MSIATQTNPTDDMIVRNRVMRWIIAIVSPILALMLGWIIGILIFALLKFNVTFGGILGLGLGFWVAVTLIKNSFIKNGAVQAFVTVDTLKSILGAGNALVSYGPGTHVCYWWETRSSGNNINLSGVTEPFAGIIQCIDGTVTNKGEFRLRPDITRLPEFLSGVATAAGNLSSLIEAEKLSFVSSKDVATALDNVDALNNHLHTKFVHGLNQQSAATELEQKYGIVIDDVTVSEMLPSKEVQETMSSVSEARIIALTVRNFLCDIKGIAKIGTAYDDAVQSGKITAAEINDTRDRIMAMSGNLQGMGLNRTQFDLNINGLADIPAESLAFLVTAAQSIAGIKAPAAANKPQGNKSGQSGRKP